MASSTRYGICTLITNDAYLPGAIALVAALRDLHPRPAQAPEVEYDTLCIVTPETVDVATIKLLRRTFDVVVGVEIIEQHDGKNLDLLGELYNILTILTFYMLCRIWQA
jgi:glycogenin